MSRCTCNPPHSRAVHRNQRGRCQVRGCQCLFAPPAKPRTVELPARGTVTVDANGVVVRYEKPKPTPAQRILGESERRRLERRLWRELELAGLPLPDEYEYRWARAEGRQYRSDGFYRCRDGSHAGWLIECDGGIWMQGGSGHSHPMHLEAQHARDNLAVLLGYRCLRFTSRQIADGTAVRTIRRALQPAERLT